MNLKNKIILGFFLLIACSLNTVAQEKVDEIKIKNLVVQLSQNPWHGAEIVGNSPTIWDFALTEPMKEILEIGNLAQNSLLENIDKPLIKDQVIFLLGGVGDEKVIEPIIRAMIPKSKLDDTPNAKKINRSANLALTNITMADVIWHHGGGIVIERCPNNSRECWEKWWKRNKKNFNLRTITQSRRYSNYPNYGVYKDKP